MHAETNVWQRVEGGGCLRAGAFLLLLGWLPVALFFAFFWNAERFAFAAACVLAGIVLLARDRLRRRVLTAEDMTVIVEPTDLAPGQEFLVALKLGGDKGTTIRWWRVELIASLADPAKPERTPDSEVFVEQEFAVDPVEIEAPVSELRMIMVAPRRRQLSDSHAVVSGWFVRATVESDRGRMESGRVGVRILRPEIGEPA